MVVQSAVVLGASGSVGLGVVEALLKQGAGRVVLVGRRAVPGFIDDGRVLQVLTTMGDSVPERQERRGRFAQAARGCEAAFITMGSGKPTGEPAAVLRHVDVDVPTEFAQACRDARVRHVGILSAVSADASADPERNRFSRVARYKGDVEDNLRALEFDSLGLFRASTLLGSPHTPALLAMAHKVLDPVLPSTYHSVEIKALGCGMVAHADLCLAAHTSGSAPRVDVLIGKTLLELCRKAGPLKTT
jgi:uncharacterized protein YbjT (DUF2867 family)